MGELMKQAILHSVCSDHDPSLPKQLDTTNLYQAVFAEGDAGHCSTRNQDTNPNTKSAKRGCLPFRLIQQGNTSKQARKTSGNATKR